MNDLMFTSRAILPTFLLTNCVCDMGDLVEQHMNTLLAKVIAKIKEENLEMDDYNIQFDLSCVAIPKNDKNKYIEVS